MEEIKRRDRSKNFTSYEDDLLVGKSMCLLFKKNQNLIVGKMFRTLQINLPVH